MQAALKALSTRITLPQRCHSLPGMEGFRQRKSLRIQEISAKFTAPTNQVVARGLNTYKRGPVEVVSGDEGQAKEEVSPRANPLINVDLDVTLPEDSRSSPNGTVRKRRKRKASARETILETPEERDVPSDVPQPVPGKIKNAKRARTAKAATARPLKPLAAVTPGAPSTTLSVWTEAEMASAVEHLKSCNPGIAALASEFGPTERLLPKGTQNMFASLARSIAGQQLATQAAFKIHSRFVAICKRTADDPVQPTDVLARSHEELRSCGFSGMKANYIHDLARHFDGGVLSDEAIAVMDDETLITELTKVKGIGRWSVDMFAMFHLGRMDVLPVGDLGIRNGMKLLYGLPGPPKAEQMEELTEGWRPYRSLGSFYLWGFLAKKTAAAKQAAAPRKKAVKSIVDKVPL